MSSEPIVSARAASLYQRMAAGGDPSTGDADAVSELLNLNLIRRNHGGPGYAVEDPAYIAARLAAQFHGEAARQLQQATEAAKAFDGLLGAFGARSGADGPALVEHLSGIEVINGRLGHIFSGCTESIDVFQPTPRIPANLARIKGRDLATLGRGVQMRTLYHDDIRGGRSMDDWVVDMTAAGAQIRTLDGSFPRMFIIDRRVTVIPGEEPDVALIVHDRGIAGFLTTHLFDFHWRTARPWGRPASVVTSGPIVVVDSRQERILELLAEGKTTKEIGALLPLRPRRMAALMSELKELYGAETLFQLACRWRESSSVS